MPISTPPKAGPDHSGHQLFNKAVRSIQMRRNAPPPIPIPINLICTEIQVATPESKTLPLVAVELSNYPPSLSRHDVQELFKGFVVSQDFILPTTTRFLFPFRLSIRITGEGEAKRAVKELSGKIMGGRQICVVLAVPVSYEQKEVVVAELADELKIAIVNAALVYYPHLASKILEVREHVEGATYFAFLQACDLITVPSESRARLKPALDTVDREFVAGGRADSRGSRGQEKSVRLAALKSLQEMVEKQGDLKKVWAQWNESSILDQERRLV